MQDEIRLLSLWQPWASLIAYGLKRYETRSWATKYRGKIAIQAALRKPDADTVLDLQDKHPEIAKAIWSVSLTDNYTKVETSQLPLGCIVAVADLTDCLLMSDCSLDGSEARAPGHIWIESPSLLEQAVGNWQAGRFAWQLDNVRPIAEPIPCKGAQGLRTLRDESILAELERQLALTQSIENQLTAIREAATHG